jgi:uncharacterized protein involved in exopolysaccharide biosynthesis
MELRRYVQIMLLYRWQLILIPVVAALVGLAATYAMSRRYVGVATVQLLPNEVEPRAMTFRDQDGAAGGPGPVAIGLRDPTELLAHGVAEQLASRDVAKSISDQLGLEQLPAPQGWDAVRAWVRARLQDVWALLRYGYAVQKPKSEATLDSVQNALRVLPVRGSYYLKVQATWADPKVASDMANAAAQAVLERGRQLARASAAERRQFLEQQLTEARARMESARVALLQYSQSADVSPGGESVRAAVNTLEGARAQLRESGLALAEAKRRQQATAQELAAQSARSGQQGTTPNPAHTAMQEQVASLQQEVAALERRSPRAAVDAQISVDAALAEARTRLAQAESALAQAQPEMVTTQTQTTESSGPGTTTSTTRATVANPAHSALVEHVAALQQEVVALELRSGRVSEEARRERERALADARGRLSEVNRQISATLPTLGSDHGPNPVYQDLERQRHGLQQEVAGLEATSGQYIEAARVAHEQTLAEARKRHQAAVDQLAQLNQLVTTTQTTDQAAQGPTRSTTQTSGLHPVYQTLQDRVAALRQEVAALETRREQAGQVAQTQTDQSLADARTRLVEAQRQLASTPALIGTPPVIATLEQQAAQLAVEVQGLETRVAEAQAQVQAQEQALRQTMGHDATLNGLAQELTVANETYRQRATAWQDAMLEEARTINQLRVIDPATPPVYPSAPIKLYWMLIGAAAGLLVATVLVFVRANTDLSLRSAEEAEGVLELPFLGNVPAVVVVPPAQLSEQRPRPLLGWRQGAPASGQRSLLGGGAETRDADQRSPDQRDA